MEAIHSVRIDHGAVPPNNGMAYSQRSQSVHRPNPSGGDTGPPHKQARTILSPPSSGAGLVSAHGVSAGAGAYHGYRYMPGPYTAYAPPAAPYRPTEYHPPAQRQIPDRQQQERQAAQDNVNRNIQNHRSLQESNRSLQEQQHRSLAEHHRNIAEQQHRGLQSEYIRQSTAQPTQQQQQQQQEHVRAAQTPQDHIREHLRNVSQQSRVFSPQDHQSPHQQQQQQSHQQQQQRNVSDHIRSIPPDHLRNQQEVLRIDGITHEQLNQSQMRPRISLLPPSAEYLSNMAPRRDMYRPPDQGMVQDLVTSHGGQMQIDMSSGQPFKKIRLGEQKVDMQPLRIDTRESTGSYNPQVEAISPTPNDHGQDDHAFRTTKDGLLQNIGRVDREIAKVESSIQKLKKKQQELEEAASKPAIKQEVEEVSQPKHQCQAQKIYAVNRKKAATAHSSLDSLGPKVEWPLYNQPSDAQVYHDNKRRHKSFKKKLLEYFKKRHAEKELREQYLTQTYSKLMQEWLRKVEKIESSQKRKAKEAKNREFFEKVFPELRKQREDKERFNRVGARIKSEADLEEIMDGLQEQELEDKKMRSYAVIPPILLDARQRKLCYANNNGHISDMESEHKERQLINVWINSEREIFKEKYLQHPKNFGLISSFLDRKSVQDCVQHYYLTKKTENYKQLLRKSRQRTRSSRNNPQKVNNAANNSIVDILTTGVTTRLQREQQQKTTVSAPHTAESTNNSQTTSTTSAGVTNSDECKSQSNKSPVSTTAQSTTVVQPAASTSPSTSVITTSLTTAVAPTTCVTAPVVSNIVTHQSAPPTVNNGASSDNLTVIANHDGQDTEKIVTSDHSSGATGNSTLEKKKKDRRKDKEKDVSMETSDEETTDVQEKGSGPHNCAVCKTELEQFTQSRPLPTTHASQYGLRADQVPAGARVCNTCRCKCIRTRYTHCPLPTCGSANAAGGANAATGANSGNPGAPNVAVSTASGATTPNTGSHSRAGRVKRLRTMPPRWATELPRDVWTAVVHEFQIPQGVTKCCSACYNRISRRLAPHLPPSSSSAGSPGAAWGEDERTKLRTLLAEHGAHWSLISEKIGRPVHQVKNFYLDQRKRLGLDMIVAEYNRTHHGDERKPVLTDEEESGSTTSSCEEIAEIIPRDRLSSDTTSANSPPETTGLSQTEGRPAKPDYDSSATETADEGQTAEEQRQNYSNQATITVVNGPNQGSRANDNVSPMTVKDLMLNVIERQLKKTPGVNSTMMPSGVSNLSGITPTISSILKSQEGQDIKFVREYKPRAQDNSSLATLSVVNSHGGHGPPAQQQQQQQQMSNMQSQQPPQLMPNVGQIAATITPIPTPQPMQLTQQSQSQQAELPREGLVVMQVQQALREREPETLDLSIKRPRDPNPPMPKMQHPLYRPPPEQYYHSKSPSVYVLATPRPKPPTPAPSPKPANPKSGSITQGTPVINQQTNVQRYDGLLRQTPPPKMGSITQGTPIHLPTHMQDKQRAYDYYAKRQSPVANYRQPSYTMEQQLSSRQIIMNDYITSQQMQHPPPRRSEKSQESPRGVVTSSPLYYEGQYVARTPPPPQRQGVIQRHRPSPPPPPRRSYAPLPGHEAFSSLVDVAVQQPQLPVPHKENHEGLGKTIADQTQRYNQQIALQHQRQRIADFNRQQMYREQMRIQQPQPPQAAPPTQQVQRSQQESSTLTAASLIDAIITHQINQSAENNAGPKENVPNIRAGDRLFQAFHTPASTIENNGSHSPGVINVDLESDGPKLTVKEFADSVINRDFGGRQAYYQHKPQPDERTIIRVAQQQKAYHASPPRSYNQPHTHMFDYVKNRIVEVMRTEDEQKETDKSDSPGEMVIDESKRDSVTPPTFTPHFAYPYNALNVGGQHVVNTNQKNEMGQNETNRQSEPKQIMSAQYEPLSDED